MKTEREFKLAIAAIIEALAETDGRCAESTFYLAMGTDMEAWRIVRGAMVDSGLVVISDSHEVSLTAKGKEIGNKLVALRQSA